MTPRELMARAERLLDEAEECAPGSPFRGQVLADLAIANATVALLRLLVATADNREVPR